MPGYIRSCSSAVKFDNFAVGGNAVGNSASGTVTCTPTFAALPGTYSLVAIGTSSTNWINGYTLSISSSAGNGGGWTNLGSDIFRGPSGQSTLSLHVFLNTSPVSGAQTLTGSFSSSGAAWLQGSVYIMSSSYTGCTGYQNITTEGHLSTSNSLALNLSQVSAPNHRGVCFCISRAAYYTTFNQTVRGQYNVSSSVAQYLFVGDAPGATGISFATTTNSTWCGGYSLDLI